MKTEWDYTDLAEAYLKRPDYSDSAIDAMLATMQLSSNALICDMGAGVAHLTLALARRGFCIHAVEPNDAMRALGRQRTSDLPHGTPQVNWFEGTGEASGQPDKSFDLLSFGSSFNVTDRQKSLQESDRILKSRGWFACMWNHRDLEDPLQAHIEACIKHYIKDYDYGVRREDQRDVIAASNLFSKVEYVEGRVLHYQSAEEVETAWRSHATLHRQAGGAFQSIISDIEGILRAHGQDPIEIPYTTRIWYAQKLL
ncbi:MAG: methyltransferase [Candidatus Melainabacteria bacterium HGW-Melainabacteria-1]|nr:MAG: methyltransferase [Candidatus Melainabacteria bacterium HGW-Melainabacteria-1]